MIALVVVVGWLGEIFADIVCFQVIDGTCLRVYKDLSIVVSWGPGSEILSHFMPITFLLLWDLNKRVFFLPWQWHCWPLIWIQRAFIVWLSELVSKHRVALCLTNYQSERSPKDAQSAATSFHWSPHCHRLRLLAWCMEGRHLGKEKAVHKIVCERKYLG